MRQFGDVHLERSVPFDQVADPFGLDIPGENDVEAGVLERPMDVDHLRAVVVTGVSIVRTRMQPGPFGSDHST